MEIAPFQTELYYALYEFNAPFMLSASDCESLTIGQLLAMSGRDLTDLARLPLHYTESQGNPQLRQAIAHSYQTVQPDEVVVLTAPEEGIYLFMHTLLQPDDEVVVLTPAYDSLTNVVTHICGPARVKKWEIVPAGDQWQLNLPQLEQQLTPKTRLVIVNFPHNPTGYLPSPTQFQALIDLLGQRGIWLFCDEMYRGLELGNSPTLPAAADLYERAVILAGLSKVHGLPGLRSGWLIIKDKTVRDSLINWKHYTTICPPAPSEFLALAALQAQDKLIARNRAIIAQNLSLAEPFFQRWAKLFTWRRPLAGSVALVEVAVPSATAYCYQLVHEAGILLLPGPFLGSPDRFVRFGTGRVNFPANLARYEQHLRTVNGEV